MGLSQLPENLRWPNLSNRTIGIIMVFGAGTLISRVSYELVFESFKIARFSGFPANGFFTGAATYYFSDILIAKFGASKRMDIDADRQSGLIIPMVLAIILDGIPESIVIGLSVFEGGTVSLAMLVAVFISNLPEAVAGYSCMKAGGWSKKKIILLWLAIAMVFSLSTVTGFIFQRRLRSMAVIYSIFCRWSNPDNACQFNDSRSI